MASSRVRSTRRWRSARVSIREVAGRAASGRGGRVGGRERGAPRVPQAQAAERAQEEGATVKQYEIWWAELPEPIGRRPVLVLTRDSAYQYLNRVLAMEVTSRVRGIPQEVALGAR